LLIDRFEIGLAQASILSSPRRRAL
jgi:hypothetical protein